MKSIAADTTVLVAPDLASFGELLTVCIEPISAATIRAGAMLTVETGRIDAGKVDKNLVPASSSSSLDDILVVSRFGGLHEVAS